MQKGGGGRRLNDYDEALEYLYSLGKFGIKLGLDNIRELLKASGNPHIGAKGAHIAGTNGKGSVAAMLSSILREGGYRVGTYTSPHLLDFEERISVNLKPIERDTLIAYVKEYRKKVAELNERGVYPTFFEVVTSIAFEHFRNAGASPWVIETGMGGKLDATNISMFGTGVITSIGIDHTEHLGKTPEKIAKEKAGIIKQGMKVVTGERGKILRIIEKRADEVGAGVFALSRDFDVKVHSVDIYGVKAEIKGIYDEYSLSVPLTGRHQALNAALAVTAAELMRDDGIHPGKEAIVSGIEKTVWRGRFEVLCTEPLVIMDAAHNPPGAAVLKRTLKDTGLWGKYTLVLGMLADKDAASFSRTLMKGALRTIITKPKYSERALKIRELEKITKKFGNVECVKEPGEAVRKAMSYGDPAIITGSIYLLGDVLSDVEFNKDCSKKFD